MKNLLKRKPSLAELTGISDSRLDCFATHLRAYLVGSNTQVPCASTTSLDMAALGQNAQSAPSPSKPSRARQSGVQGAKPSSFYQSSLSPRPSSFKEGPPRNLASLRSAAREKFRRRGEGSLSCVDNFSISSPIITDASISNQSGKGKLPESSGTCVVPPSSVLESLEKSVDMPFFNPTSQIPPTGSSSLFSPHYCWCPPVASTLQYTVGPSQTPISSTESFSLPPLSSLLSHTPRSSTLLSPTPPLKLPELEYPSLDFPPFLPEPMVRLPLSLPLTSQQIPTFTPFMCDPIVHIPVIDICSSGQAYLVSAGPPGISSSIPPLHQSLVNPMIQPLIQETDSIVEKSARETLRLLINGSRQSMPQLMGEKHNILACGSRARCTGATDVNTIASVVLRRCVSQSDLADLHEEPGGSGGNCSDGDDESSFSESGEASTE